MAILDKICAALYNRTLYRLRVKKQSEKIPSLLAYLWEVRKEPEIKKISEYVRSHPKSIMPYDFTEKYKILTVEISRDTKSKFIRAKVNGKSIYFPVSFTEEYVLESVRVDLMEQDDQSPHRYIHLPGEKFSGRYAVLAGASDCMFALDVVQNFEKVFLFEADKRWHGPMRETMKEFSDKIKIVPKRIGDNDSEKSVRLDTFFQRRYKDVNFIQADIEGNEVKMLSGARKLFEEAVDLKLSVSCYHQAISLSQAWDNLCCQKDSRPKKQE